MTDKQILIALAEKLMGWKYTPGIVFANVGEFYIMTIFNHLSVMVNDGKETKGGSTNNWNPLTSDTDACAVLDKMDACGFNCGLSANNIGWECTFCQSDNETFRYLAFLIGGDRSAMRRRAICIAALKAVGASQE